MLVGKRSAVQNLDPDKYACVSIVCAEMHATSIDIESKRLPHIKKSTQAFGIILWHLITQIPHSLVNTAIHTIIIQILRQCSIDNPRIIVVVSFLFSLSIVCWIIGGITILFDWISCARLACIVIIYYLNPIKRTTFSYICIRQPISKNSILDGAAPL